MARSLVLLYSFIAFTQAYKTSQPNCTAPITSVNFFASSETRGTLDILWSCLFTIVACTWTVQHLNVPEQREDRDEGWRGDIKWALKRTWSSAKWMLATAIAPEILIGKNWSDLIDIDEDHKKLSDLARQDEVPWSKTHTLLANMGGFVIRSHVPKRIGRLNRAKPEARVTLDPGIELQDISNSRGSEGTMSGPLLSTDNIETSNVETQSLMHSSDYSNPYHLLASDLVALREASIIERLPYISISELGDKSKSDSFVRFIAVTQILWMAIQILIRVHRHLAIAQLEIAVAAFALCAIVIYGLNWKKPKGVQTPYTILQFHGNIPSTAISHVGNWRETAGSTIFGLVELFKSPVYFGFNDGDVRTISGPPIRNHFTPNNADSKSNWAQISGLFIGGIMFGAVHLMGWDFIFPSLIEKKLWWASSVYLTSSPVVLFILTFLMKFMSELEKPIFRVFLLNPVLIFYIFMFVLYFAARLFLLVEIFRTLCFLPPSAYIATWAANVPHIT